MQLTSPLKRGSWLRTTSGGEAWVKYHWEKQSYHICDQCWVIDHSDDTCAQIALQLQLDSMSQEEYEIWSLEQKDHEVVAATEGEAGVVNISGATIHNPGANKENESLFVEMTRDENDNAEERQIKRSRNESSNSSQNSINEKKSQPSLLKTSNPRPKQSDLKLSDVKMKSNQSETSSNQTEPMEGVEMEEIEENPVVEVEIVLINNMGDANKGNSKDAKQSQAKH
ncbi:uncharacterized protein LOC113315549 [Papaver somniferum]|uniref:uncharacterized protein LOC113315549 n=1 Tax=Papaver somniferum TaxID=3469 RepID=UPI000E6FCC0C|nr:uncharacterized protein LOC113315549 [Papaver somniferum]